MNPGDDATFVRQAREAGVKIPIIGGDAFDNPDLVKNGGANNTVDVYFTTHMAMSTDNPLVAKFIDAYKAEYGIPAGECLRRPRLRLREPDGRRHEQGVGPVVQGDQ